jgi:hypothetical protein
MKQLPGPGWRVPGRGAAPRPRPAVTPVLPGEERWLHPPAPVTGDAGPAAALLRKALSAPLLPAQQQQVPAPARLCRCDAACPCARVFAEALLSQCCLVRLGVRRAPPYVRSLARQPP